MRLRVVGTAASLLAVAPGVSFALGFGEIQLRSTLNAPLNAEIDLIATAEELASLRTQLASRDAFSRAGLDYPAFLSSIQVRVERRADGRAFLRLTSSAPMTEPFATILVEASDSTGSRFREFTMLFDPPTFAPAPVASTPPPVQVAAPVVGGGDRSATITRPAAPATAPVRPAPSATAPSAPVSRPAPVAAGDEYTVRGGDSLSAIARRQYGSGEADRAMMAIYRGNQHAFDGNINRLRAGTVLRLPDNSTVSAVNAAEASAEVRRQAASWRSETASAPATTADPRLVLIPPATTGTARGNSAETQALRDQVAALQAEVAEKNRLLTLRTEELAARTQATPAPATQVPTTPEPVVTPAPAPAPVATTPVTPEPAKTEPAAAADESRTSLIDILKQYWWAPAGLVAFLLALLGVRAARRRRETSSDNLAPFDIPAVAPVRDTSSDTFPLRKPLSEADERSILVEESGTHERPPPARKDTRTVDLEDSATSMSVPALDATAALEQGDPLAEADFHMAYGLYDQAADLVKLAIMREPERRDLKLKLLEVFFVWGNKDQFLQTARDLADTRDSSGPGEWEKVVIMGKQLAPEDALFSQSYSGTGPASVDLNLEGGQNLVDFDLHGEPSVSLTRDGGIDLGGASGNDATGSLSGLDFVLDDPARGNTLERTATTRQMAQPGLAGLDDGATRRMETDGPTVEQPTLDRGVDSLVGKIDAHAGYAGSDQTAELAIDDLGLDLGKFDATGTNATLLDDSQLARALEAADSPTLVAGLDDTARTFVEGGSEENQPTELLPMGDFGEMDDAAATARVAMLDLEFDLDSNAETGKRKAIREGDAGLDLDVGAPDRIIDDEFQRTQPVKLVSDADQTERDLEPVTMSEVGTKLDLARAYMDMGDPDGARSILREVLQEGSANQRQEAQRLIDSIPG